MTPGAYQEARRGATEQARHKPNHPCTPSAGLSNGMCALRESCSCQATCFSHGFERVALRQRKGFVKCARPCHAACPLRQNRRLFPLRRQHKSVPFKWM